VFLPLSALAKKITPALAFYQSLISALSQDFNYSVGSVENYNLDVEKSDKFITT
jgi:hypothetical protein